MPRRRAPIARRSRSRLRPGVTCCSPSPESICPAVPPVAAIPSKDVSCPAALPAPTHPTHHDLLALQQISIARVPRSAVVCPQLLCGLVSPPQARAERLTAEAHATVLRYPGFRLSLWGAPVNDSRDHFPH